MSRTISQRKQRGGRTGVGRWMHLGEIYRPTEYHLDFHTGAAMSHYSRGENSGWQSWRTVLWNQKSVRSHSENRAADEKEERDRRTWTRCIDARSITSPRRDLSSHGVSPRLSHRPRYFTLFSRRNQRMAKLAHSTLGPKKRRISKRKQNSWRGTLYQLRSFVEFLRDTNDLAHADGQPDRRTWTRYFDAGSSMWRSQIFCGETRGCRPWHVGTWNQNIV